MNVNYCRFCGKELDEYCGCEEVYARIQLDIVEDYYDSPETHIGWSQQDIIDTYRREK